MRGTPVREAAPRPGDDAHTLVGPAGFLSGPWLLTGHDGRLIVFAHVEGAVLRWTERRPGGPEWDGPDVLPVKHLTHLTVVQGRNRYAHLVGRRARRTGQSLAVDLVYAIQYQAGRPLSEWRSLGNPHAKPERTAQLGEPTGVVDSSGTLHVLAPTAEGHLALRREDKQGRWEPWKDLGVAACTGVPAAAATSDGLVEILAPGRGSALIWGQQEPAGTFRRGTDLPVVPLPGTGVAVETSSGRATHYVTDARTGGIVAVRAGEWPVPLEGVVPGDGRHAALGATVDGYACTVLAHRALDGTVVLGVCVAEQERSGVWWTDTGMPSTADPTLALDGHGRVVVLAVTRDGAPVVARQEAGQGLTLGGWNRI
ncbi:hypothetical protein [Streptomyces longispororuber]|uniref:hypothetical protein n=1 Tax=Streptomyces longispororuber TaxID=68230 RepID=UPI00210C6A71|nr:hypothetical protein [Streptomyces longispororuber]MCQ4210620.1 hypothetical protein [Streptomyces longispororuber]